MASRDRPRPGAAPWGSRAPGPRWPAPRGRGRYGAPPAPRCRRGRCRAGPRGPPRWRPPRPPRRPAPGAGPGTGRRRWARVRVAVVVLDPLGQRQQGLEVGRAAGTYLHARQCGRCPGRDGASPCHARVVAVHLDDAVGTVDWARAVTDLAADDFDNGRSLTRCAGPSKRPADVVFARDDADGGDGGGDVIGMARLLSDGVCNAYLLDVWTLLGPPPARSWRRRWCGPCSPPCRASMSGCRATTPRPSTGRSASRPEPQFFSMVVGTWLDPRPPEP